MPLSGKQEVARGHNQRELENDSRHRLQTGLKAFSGMSGE